ncbi:MAG: hypothetical protein ACKV1O_11865 [Saprospiraceae bacterium]
MMSTTMKEHATTMSPQEEQAHQLNQSIQQYELEDWVAAIPGGFQTLRLFSDWKIALLIIKLVVLGFTFLKAYSELPPGDSGWFTVLTVVILGLVVFALIFGLTRKVVFDLENGEVLVTLLGNPISRKPLQDFNALSHRYGTTLYIEFNDLFKDQGKIRIVDMGNGKALENLQSFILEALAMNKKVSAVQPSIQREMILAEKPDTPLFPDQNHRILDLDALRNAVRNDTQHHNIKKLAELLIMALNDWPREALEIEATIKEMKAYFGEPMTVERLKGKRFDYSMPYNSWRLEAGASLWQMLELSAKLENESDFDKIVARILNYYDSCESREARRS